MGSVTRRIAEVPITLGVRKNGYSKMAYTRAFWLGYARLILRLYFRNASSSPARATTAEDVTLGGMGGRPPGLPPGHP